MNQLLSIIRKEFIHIRNDVQTLMVIFLFPIFMLVLYGYAITLDMRNIPTIIEDHSNTPISRQFIERLQANKFFQVLNPLVFSDAERVRYFQENTARCILIIPKDFASARLQKQGAKLQLLIDASDPNAAALVQNYVALVLIKQFPLGKPLLQVEPRFLYNSDQRAANFFVPGLVALIVILICALLTSVAIAKEKETGTFEQMLVSSILPIQIILGKVVPYMLIAFLSGVIVLVAGITVFQVTCIGSIWFLLVMLLLYTLVGLSFGLLISTVVETQQNAMILALMATMLPNMMLSGFIFPIESMPKIFQYLSYIVPARHFSIIIRGIMLKGSSLEDIAQPVLILIVMIILLLAVSIKKFKMRLE